MSGAGKVFLKEGILSFSEDEENEPVWRRRKHVSGHAERPGGTSKHVLWEEMKPLNMAAAQNVMQIMARDEAENVL